MSDGKVMVEFDHVSRRYTRGARRGSLRDAIPALGARLLRRGQSTARDGDTAAGFWALRDVCFQVRHGEALGIIGHNGAGKSTILKLLAGVTAPTSGHARVSGRFAALIELGAGFHPDLTGRENIYLNGSILGLKRAEIDRKLDSIVDFAGIEKFIDMQVKRYSSGMHARLGFAIAAHVEPEILLIDEVLSVGDFAFQQKCMKKMEEFRLSGAAIVFVSHNLDAVQGLCNRAIYLSAGEAIMDAAPTEVISRYLSEVDKKESSSTLHYENDEKFSPDLTVTRIVCRDEHGVETDQFTTGRPLIVDIEYSCNTPVSSPIFSIGISDGLHSTLVLASMLIDGRTPHQIEGMGTMRCRFDTLSLLPRNYQIYCSVRNALGFQDIVPWKVRAVFRIVNVDSAYVDIGPGANISHVQADAPVYVPYTWEHRNSIMTERSMACVS